MQKFNDATIIIIIGWKIYHQIKFNIVVSRDISFSGQFTPLETAFSTHCNEDGLLYTVDLITKWKTLKYTVSACHLKMKRTNS